MKVITNNVPREVIDAGYLTEDEQRQFDYLDWDALRKGEDSASFVRYKGVLYDLGEFSADYGITRGSGLPDELSGWDGYMADSMFSAVVIRYARDDRGDLDPEWVVMGRVMA